MNTAVIIWILITSLPAVGAVPPPRPLLAFKTESQCERVMDTLNFDVPRLQYRCVAVAVIQ